MHRAGKPNLFRLLVTSILADLPVPSRKLSDVYRDMQNAGRISRQTSRPVARAISRAESVQEGLTNHLPEVVTETNRILARLQLGTEVDLAPPTNLTYSKQLRGYVGEEVRLIVRYQGHEPAEPQHFLNEARLTAIALSIYLAGARITRSGRPGILVLDDILIGLDISNRLPLLDILKEDFGDWQVLLFTHDRSWYELAIDQTDERQWCYEEMYARLHDSGRDLPVQESHAPHLDRAWSSLQNNDYKAAGVYLRSAFERILRDFCVARALKAPLKGNLRDYKSEDFWPLVKSYQVVSGRPLLDPGLVCEINMARRYVLNPLCHDDPSRPNREEARRAHASLERLQVLLNQDLSWRASLSDKLRSATRDILGDNENLRNRALRGLAPPSEFALAAACRMIQQPLPALPEIALLLRSAFDKMLFAYCDAKDLRFTIRCSEELTTQQLWTTAKDGASGLTSQHPDFAAGVEAERAILLDPDPARDVCAAKTKIELENVCELLVGATCRTDANPRPEMANF